MKNQETNIKTRSIEVGTYVSEEYFNTLKTDFNSKFSPIKPSVEIEYSLIEKSLNFSDDVTGIRFVYGLKDKHIPSSLVIFLVTCTSRSEYDKSTQPIIIENGYYGSDGEKYSIIEICEMTSNFIQAIKSLDDSMIYKKITRGIYFGREKLLSLNNKTLCTQIDFHLGLTGGRITSILIPFNNLAENSPSLFLDLGNLCPDECDGNFQDPEDESCLVSMIVDNLSNKERLNGYRSFRDEKLLHLKDGATYFELYYFISPIITHIISNSENKEEKMEEIFNNKILKFGDFLENNEIDEAYDLLKNTFTEWCDTYKHTVEI